MSIEEVKEYIGEENWLAFGQWMNGQTIGGEYDENGKFIPDYYPDDVKAFKEKLNTGFDRQKSVFWD